MHVLCLVAFEKKMTTQEIKVYKMINGVYNILTMSYIYKDRYHHLSPQKMFSYIGECVYIMLNRL